MILVDEFAARVHDEVLAALAQLDGSKASAVRLLTGMTQAELDELGGIEE